MTRAHPLLCYIGLPSSPCQDGSRIRINRSETSFYGCSASPARPNHTIVVSITSFALALCRFRRPSLRNDLHCRYGHTLVALVERRCGKIRILTESFRSESRASLTPSRYGLFLMLPHTCCSLCISMVRGPIRLRSSSNVSV